MSPKLRWLMLAVLPLLSGNGFMLGYPPIYCEQPLGSVANLNPVDWNGVWLRGSNGALVRVLFEKAEGELVVSMVENDDIAVPKESILEFCIRKPHRTFAVRQINSDVFIPVGEPLGPSTGAPEGVYKIETVAVGDGHVLFFYLIDERPVRKLLARGALPGRVEKTRQRPEVGEVVLGPLAPEHLELLFSSENPAISRFPLDIYIKLPTELDPCKAPAQAK